VIPVLTVLTVALLTYCAAAYTVFVVRYSRLRWKASRMGRHIMGQSRVLAVMLWVTLVFLVAPVSLTVALWINVVLFGWLAFEATRRNRNLTLEQRDARAGRNH
jgi:cobalamin synthase